MAGCCRRCCCGSWRGAALLALLLAAVPGDPRWVFATPGNDTRACPVLTSYNDRLGGCIYARKPAQQLFSFLQGGVRGRQESLQHLGSRSSFFRTDFMENGHILPHVKADARAHTFIEQLRDSAPLGRAAKELFRGEALRPYAIYGNVILPGQELPLHTDVPAYRGLTRADLPS